MAWMAAYRDYLPARRLPINMAQLRAASLITTYKRFHYVKPPVKHLRQAVREDATICPPPSAS